MHALSIRKHAPDAHRLQNIHWTLKPGLGNELNLHSIQAKRDKEIDALGEKTPKADVISTVIRMTFFYLSKVSLS